MDMFVQFSLIILVVLAVSSIMRFLKQPLIIGYILSGILLGPIFLNLVANNETITLFSEIGIAFLLFIVGIHLSPKVIKEVGKISLITGIGQIVFTSLIGFTIAIALGFNWITSLYVSIALTFSSTIIIMKLLSDKEALEKLYGKISIGFLLVQDFVAIIALIVIASFSLTGNSGSLVIFSTIIKGAILTAVLIPISYYVLPKLNTFFAKSQEFLFIFSIAWGLGLASLFFYAGLTIEVGALIAGIVLSISPYSYEVSSRLKSLRDFFIISFFLVLGSQMVFGDLSNLIIPAVIFSLFILIGNPLIVMILMGVCGYSKKTGFMAGLTVAQISEFSLILIALGVKVGQISQEILSFVTLIGLVTIAGSTYMILYSDKIYSRISRFLYIFERKNLRQREIPDKKYKYVLLGYNRIGYSILKAFSKITNEYIVIDFDPRTIQELKSQGIPCIYGDMDDIDFMEEMRLNKSQVIVSTIPEKETSLLLLSRFKKKNGPLIILTSRQISDALELYDCGATYVILPHFLGGEFVSGLIEKAKAKAGVYNKERAKQLVELKERLKRGHEHPEVIRHKKN